MRPHLRPVPVVSGVQRHCRWGDHWVPTRDAAEVYTTTVMSGPETPVYACWPHVYEHDLQTTSQAPTSPWIGRRDAAPIIPGRGAP